MVRFENESYQSYLNFLHDLLVDNSSISKELDVDLKIVEVCEKIMHVYLNCNGSQSAHQEQEPVNKLVVHWILPLGSTEKEASAARTTLLVSALHLLSNLNGESYRRYVSRFFPLLVDLVQSEHSSRDVHQVLSNIFQSCIGQVLM